jgi:hypothetical protein
VLLAPVLILQNPKVGGTEALKIIAKETAMSIKDAGAFVNDLVRGRGFGNVRAIGRLKSHLFPILK